MEKTKSINIAQKIYTLDTKAYENMNKYLINLRKQYPENLEICQDVEIRISELLEEIINNDKDKIISTVEVSQILEKLGSIDENTNSTKLGFFDVVKKVALLSGKVLVVLLLLTGIGFGIFYGYKYLTSIHFTNKQIEKLNTKSIQHYYPQKIQNLSAKLMMNYKEVDYYIYASSEIKYKGKNKNGNEIFADLKDQSNAVYNSEDGKSVSIKINRYKSKDEAKKGTQIINQVISSAGEGFQKKELNITNVKSWFLYRDTTDTIGDKSIGEVFIMIDKVPVSIQMSFGKGFLEKDIKDFTSTYLSNITNAEIVYMDEDSILTSARLIEIQLEKSQENLEEIFDDQLEKNEDWFDEKSKELQEEFDKNKPDVFDF